MNTLIQHVCILSRRSTHHQQIRDVLLNKGIIEKISKPGESQMKADRLIDGTGLFLSSGWFDLHVNFRDPGSEHKEDLVSGCKAAMQGGFTGVLCMPDTSPPIHSKSEVEFIRKKTAGELVDVIPCGSLSHQLEGKDLSEMYDMFQAGAPVFSDHKHSIQDSGLMIRALLYSKNFNGRILCTPNDYKISIHGQVNEGIHSTALGLKGIPSIAEEVMIARDLFLSEYTDAPVHFSTITTGKSVELIRDAKKKGLQVTADVSVAHLFFDDSVLHQFDTNFKIIPPLRTPDDILALIGGLRDGTIDAICSDHCPENIENKNIEFEHALPGMSGLETAFAAMNTVLKTKLPLTDLVERITAGPRKIVGLSELIIEEKQPANLTLFNREQEWKVTENQMQSKSRNNPFLGMTLTGKPVAVFNKDQMLSCN